MATKKLTRSTNKILAGVCGGIAEYFEVDPTMIRVAEFWKVKGCPLARALRQRFKKLGHRPARKFLCVYSESRPTI